MIASDPQCKPDSYDGGVMVTCTYVHGWVELSNAQRNYSDGKSDRDVKYLALYHSEIITVSEIFVIFPNLDYLNLGSNSLNYLDKNSFKNASLLNRLYLGNNNLTSLHNGTFTGAENLRMLYFDYNQIKVIDSDTFAPLIHLEILSLAGNKLTQILPQTFQKLTTLLSLSLAQNWLTELQEPTFQQLNKLQELHLYGNQLKSLNGRLLSRNGHLERLYIMDCGIEAIERNFFDNLKLLNHVKSERNVCVDKDLYDITNISSVVEFEQCFKNYDNIALQNNELCDYKVDPKLGYTCEMRNVTYLNHTPGFSISGTHITGHQDTDVVAVKFVNSTLSKIPSTIFRKFTNLARLSVKQVGLLKLDNNTFEECGKLKVFDASLNEINEITNNAFDRCNSLTNIDLSDNFLRILRNQVFTGTELESIILDGNKITAIEPCNNSLGSLPNLKYLSLKWNICVHKSYYNEQLSREYSRLVTPDLKVCFTYWFLN